MTRVFYFVGGLIALTLILVAQSVVQAPAADTGPSQAEAAPAAVPAAADATVVAIDDLAAWPAAAGR